MRLHFVTGSVSRLSGGLFESVRHLSGALSGIPETSISVTGSADEWTNVDKECWGAVDIAALPVRGPQRFGWVPDLRSRLEAVNPDLVHLQFLWCHPSLGVRSWARRTKRPHVVSPRGMLDPVALATSAWKKRAASLLFERSNLNEAACLHALSMSEYHAIRTYGLKNPVCVVANGVALPPLPPDRSQRPPPWTLVSLGRIHPKKGLDALIRGWAQWQLADSANAGRWRLKIAGWDDGGHERSLRKLCSELNLEHSVEFAGPVHGDAKNSFLVNADAFVLASRSEGLPMAVLEAWAQGLPTLISDHCNLPEGFATGAAIRIAPTEAGVAASLESLSLLSAPARTEMGRIGRRLVEESFSWPHIAARMHAVYAWLLQGAPKPDWVHE